MQLLGICQRTTGGGMHMTPSKGQIGWATRYILCVWTRNAIIETVRSLSMRTSIPRCPIWHVFLEI